MKRRVLVITVISALVLAIVMVAAPASFAAVPFISGLSPTSGPPDTTVVLTGGDWGRESDTSIDVTYIADDGQQHTASYPQSWYIMTPTTLTFNMPADAKPGYVASIEVMVWGGGISNKVNFTFTSGPPPRPNIDYVVPDPFSSRGIVTIGGNGFGDVRNLDGRVVVRRHSDGVEFQPESYPVWSAGEIKFRVPTLAVDLYDFLIYLSTSSEAAEISSRPSSSIAPPPQDVVIPTSRTWATDSVGTAAASKTWYMPEGSTAGGDEMWVLVQNPNGAQASVALTYITGSGSKKVDTSVPANSRQTFKASDVYPGNPGISAKVESNLPVVAEKAVYGNSSHWAHESIGVAQTATNWYLAEGCTAPGYSTRVSVMNPNAAAAKIALTYMTPSGPKAGPSETLAPNSRKSYDVGATVSSSWSVSTQVTSDVPVAAERVMFGSGGNWAHDSVGVSATAKTWYLAEGSTGAGFETWVLVQNPNTTPAKVNLTYMTENGAVAGPEKTIGAKSRETFEVAQTVPGTWSVSTKVTSDQPVVAERAMYLDNRQKDATDSIGVSTLAKTWYLAEGCTLPGFESWVLVQNPNDTPAKVTFTYMTANGAQRGPSETLAPNSRKTYNIADTVNLCDSVSTKVTSDSNIAVERSMYGNPK
ncbi:MAG: IPT/TIG domain-containing protein [Candidatus Geothermincolia bacterium]